MGAKILTIGKLWCDRRSGMRQLRNRESRGNILYRGSLNINGHIGKFYLRRRCRGKENKTEDRRHEAHHGAVRCRRNDRKGLKALRIHRVTAGEEKREFLIVWGNCLRVGMYQDVEREDQREKHHHKADKL